jgi:predicted DNA-binding transcriptional regulator AlpA
MIWSTRRRSLPYLGSPTEIASPLTSGDTRPCRVRWLRGAAGIPSFGPGRPSWLGRGAAAGSRRVPWADERRVQGRRGQICSATRSRKPTVPTGGLARLARTILHVEISNTALGPPQASYQLRPGHLLVDRQLIMLLVDRQDESYTPFMTQDLIGVAEVAEILGVSRQRVHQLVQSEADFPKPEAVISAGRIWLRPTIEEWARQHPRRQSSVGSPHLSGA